MFEEKKKYLNLYKAQEIKIKRWKQMIKIDPENKKIYQENIRDSLKLRNEIEKRIKAVPDEVLSELLYQKYIFGKTLEEASFIINYSKRHTERLHIKALEKFTK